MVWVFIAFGFLSLHKNFQQNHREDFLIVSFRKKKHPSRPEAGGIVGLDHFKTHFIAWTGWFQCETGLPCGLDKGINPNLSFTVCVREYKIHSRFEYDIFWINWI